MGVRDSELSTESLPPIAHPEYSVSTSHRRSRSLPSRLGVLHTKPPRETTGGWDA